MKIKKIKSIIISNFLMVIKVALYIVALILFLIGAMKNSSIIILIATFFLVYHAVNAGDLLNLIKRINCDHTESRLDGCYSSVDSTISNIYITHQCKRCQKKLPVDMRRAILFSKKFLKDKELIFDAIDEVKDEK